MGLSDSGHFEAGCRGSESRLSLIVSKPARQDGFFIYIYIVVLQPVYLVLTI
jgi:hypothetical protein